ncbi:hypothetical protein T492DRAFT_912216 [Pavlovales sp. CCMP2436]|nr:hypothetical protein T492DRAFT_912216 [Pavlovales sp. CCMP2436]
MPLDYSSCSGSLADAAAGLPGCVVEAADHIGLSAVECLGAARNGEGFLPYVTADQNTIRRSAHVPLDARGYPGAKGVRDEDEASPLRSLLGLQQPICFVARVAVAGATPRPLLPNVLGLGRGFRDAAELERRKVAQLRVDVAALTLGGRALRLCREDMQPGGTKIFPPFLPATECTAHSRRARSGRPRGLELADQSLRLAPLSEPVAIASKPAKSGKKGGSKKGGEEPTAASAPASEPEAAVAQNLGRLRRTASLAAPAMDSGSELQMGRAKCKSGEFAPDGSPDYIYKGPNPWVANVSFPGLGEVAGTAPSKKLARLAAAKAACEAWFSTQLDDDEEGAPAKDEAEAVEEEEEVKATKPTAAVKKSSKRPSGEGTGGGGKQAKK